MYIYLKVHIKKSQKILCAQHVRPCQIYYTYPLHRKLVSTGLQHSSCKERERDCEDRSQRIYFYHFHQPKQNQFCRRFEQCLVVEKIVMTRLLDMIQNNHVKFTRKSVLSSIVGIILVLTLCLVNQQQPTTISNYLGKYRYPSANAVSRSAVSLYANFRGCFL